MSSKRKLEDITNLPTNVKTSEEDENNKKLKGETVIIDDSSNKGKSSREEANVNIDEELLKVNSCLKKANDPVEFAVEGEAQELLPCLICLEVKNFGVLSLPFQDPQASELIKQCEQSPYGKKDKTLLAKNVRDSYQLEPSQFSIKHPDWNQKLAEIVSRVANELGCDKKIEAKIYKLLVYTKGGHFLKHQDTEKEKRMFGTLIVQLPSIHTGGELVVYDSSKKNKRIIDFGGKSGKSRYSVHFAAHYADLEHELLEVKSGYRLALVYSLCWAHGTGNVKVEKPIANLGLSHELVEIFKAINNNPYHLGILLEHQYTHQSFSETGFGALKGVDHNRYKLLAHANELLPADKQLVFYICKASLKINLIIDGDPYDDYDPYEEVDEDEEEEEDEEESDEESKEQSKKSNYSQDSNDSHESYGCKYIENEREYIFEDWYDAKGKPVCLGNSRISREFFTKVLNPSGEENEAVDLLQKRIWGKYITVDFEGYTGNEGGYKDIQYNKYFLAMWPKRFQFDFMLQLNLSRQISSVYNSIVTEKKPIDDELKLNYDAIMRHLRTNKDDFNRLNSEHFSQLFDLIRIFSKKEDFESFLSDIKIKFNADTIKSFSLLVSHFGFGSMKRSLKAFFNVSSLNFTKICRFIQFLDDQVATEVFNHFLLPFIKNPQHSKTIIELAFGLSGRYYESNFELELPISLKPYTDFNCLIKLYSMFPDEIKPLFETLKDMAPDLMNRNKEFSSLIEALADELNVFQCCYPLIEVIEQRMKWLEKKLAERVPFSWRMPKAVIPGHPEVERFLRGDQLTMNYPFHYVKDLRNFIRSYSNSYSWGPSEYSVEMKEIPGKIANIRKTRRWFDQQEAVFTSYENDLARIRSLLNL